MIHASTVLHVAKFFNLRAMHGQLGLDGEYPGSLEIMEVAYGKRLDDPSYRINIYNNIYYPLELSFNIARQNAWDISNSGAIPPQIAAALLLDATGISRHTHLQKEDAIEGKILCRELVRIHRHQSRDLGGFTPYGVYTYMVLLKRELKLCNGLIRTDPQTFQGLNVREFEAWKKALGHNWLHGNLEAAIAKEARNLAGNLASLLKPSRLEVVAAAQCADAGHQYSSLHP